MQDVFVIDDLATLKVIADPTRAALIELLIEPRSVTQLAAALDVPRTRLYRHVELLRSKGLIRQVAERRVGALTESIYALTAKTFRPSTSLLTSGDVDERVDAIATLVFDATKSDLRRSIATGEVPIDGDGVGRLGVGRSIAHLTEEQAADFAAELEALVARFDAAHDVAEESRPFAFVWALYPSSRRIG